MGVTVLEYNRAHNAVRRVYGRADDYHCVDCDGPAMDWSQEHDTDPWDPKNYWPRCRKCHKKYDYKPWSPDRIHGNKGMIHTPDTRAKMSSSMKGRKAHNKKVDDDILAEMLSLYPRFNFTEIAEILDLGRTTVGWYIRHSCK